MLSLPMDFLTSKKEIKRRKYAFLALISTFYIGLIIFSKLVSLQTTTFSFLLILVLLIIFYILTCNYFNYLSNNKISIQKGYIERKNKQDIERYLISEIKRVGIKKRNNGNIREISIFFTNKKNLYINAFEEDFKTIEEILLKSITKEVVVKESKEPIDYDSLLFYPLLGLTIGFVSIFAYSQVVLADYSITKMLFPLFSVYLLSLGIYFLTKRPIATGSGKNLTKTDNIFGICMIVFSILIFFVFILY
jgi:ABC-type multidrug transport system fused ATPase/permease subunit